MVPNYQNLKKLGNVTVPFGGRTRGEGFHAGIDLANAKGTPIPAMTPGVVTAVANGFQSEDGKGYGNRVQIKDPQGNIHQYAHLQQPMVRPGQVIGKGQQVGKMGDTGNSYSPTGGDSSHLDYRIKTPQGNMQNPAPYAASALSPTGQMRGQGGPAEKEKTGKTKVILIRHGTTGLNSDGKLRGWKDIPLNRKGETEVKALGKDLKKHKIDVIVTSDLVRAKQTALSVAEHAKIPQISINHNFRPWHLGDLAGKDVKETLPTLEHHAGNIPDQPIPGGESFNNFKNRFLSAIKDIHSKHAGKTIAVVAHHRNDRTMAAWEKKGMPDDLSVDVKTFMKKGIEPATARKIVLDRREKRTDDLTTRLSKAHTKFHHPLTYLKK